MQVYELILAEGCKLIDSQAVASCLVRVVLHDHLQVGFEYGASILLLQLCAEFYIELLFPCLELTMLLLATAGNKIKNSNSNC